MDEGESERRKPALCQSSLCSATRTVVRWRLPKPERFTGGQAGRCSEGRFGDAETRPKRPATRTVRW